MKLTKIATTLFLCILSFGIYAQDFQSLAGKWRFALDPNNEGLNKKLTDQISLPGTTDEAHFGEKTTGSDFGILTRAYKYYGPAWYEREITIPQGWADKRIYLNLERVMWESRVYLDGKELSVKDALNSAHKHDLGYISPGKHTLRIRINNDMIHNIGDKGHVYTEYTQSIWNGAVGEIGLLALDKIHLTNPQVFTKISPLSIAISDEVVNETSKKVLAEIHYSLKERLTGNVVLSGATKQLLAPGNNSLTINTHLPQDIKLWSDMSPELYILDLSVSTKDKICDSKELEIGIREVTASKSKILINGKPVFLRGNLDCVHFPLTGYPSCNVEDWEKIFRIYKDYGLNHVRFHSWCPPKAAFVAADRIGIYIQAETIWIDWWMTNTPDDRKDMITKGNPEGLGKNPSADKFVQQELSRMIDAYGNNPSFVMQCIGNELGNSDFDVMESWLVPLREKDSRRLYSVSSARKVMAVDQYMATHYIDKIGATRGLKGGASTDWDFESSYSQSNIPVIAHEIGQWPVYPRWEEIKKYKGVLKARNFEEFREMARKNKIEDQNEQFVKASGALNQIMYKYEIESFLRTPSCAGIQLLSMQDYQGQGEALIGWLDVFYDSKGVTTPEIFRHHHDTIVPLLRMPKYVWKSEEPFTAKIQIANYGSSDLTDEIYWKISDQKENIISSGTLNNRKYARGSSDIAGEISADFKNITTAKKLKVTVGTQREPISNSWNIWVYPTIKEVESKIYVANRYDKECISRLEKGEKVLLVASELGDQLSADAINFYPLYWSLTFFPGQGKNTIGMVVDDKHPALSKFPTDSHSDWQWQTIYKDAKAFYINDFAADYRPIAQPVDDFHRNNKLASIFELKVGKGKLLVCGFDINSSENMVASTLKSSLLGYMNSDQFNPTYEIDSEKLSKMFTYIEPLKSEVPSEFANAVLYIDCAKNHATANQSETWKPTSDKFEAKKSTTYTVQCDGTWKDNKTLAWHGTEITLEIAPPQGMIGSLYVCFSDSNKQGRTGDIIFEGRKYSLARHDKEDIWVKFHVMREDSNDGSLVLKANATKGGNLMITKVALVEE